MTNYNDLREEEYRNAKLELERVGEKLEGLDIANVGLMEKIFKFPSRLKRRAQRNIALRSMSTRIHALGYMRGFLNETTPEAYEAVAFMSEILVDDSDKRLPKKVKAVYTGLMEEINAYKIDNNLGIVSYASKADNETIDFILSEGRKNRDEVREEVDCLEWFILNAVHERSPERERLLMEVAKKDELAAIVDEMENGLYSSATLVTI